jgi:hypothetical protein
LPPRAYWPRWASVSRSGALEIRSRPSNGRSSARIRKIALDTESADTNKAATVVGLLGAKSPNRVAEALKVLREEVPDPRRVDVHDVQPFAIRRQCCNESAARVLVCPCMLADNPAGLDDHEHRLVLTRPGHVQSTS